jgi:hypothetical protein
VANAVGLIHEAIWRDPHWRKLSRSAQCLYMQLLSQKDLDCAGILPLQISKWAKGCDGVTEADMEADLAELQAERFVFIDLDTDEAFIRSYMRNSNVLKVPNMIKSAMRSARLVASENIRTELAAELRRTNRAEAAETADQIDPKGGTLPEPFANPSGTLPEPTGVGKGKGKGVTLSSTQVGGAAPPICRKHEANSDAPCHACRKRRQWDQQQTEVQAADELLARRQAKDRADSCPTCHGTNWIPDTDPAVKCHHEAAANA